MGVKKSSPLPSLGLGLGSTELKLAVMLGTGVSTALAVMLGSTVSTGLVIIEEELALKSPVVKLVIDIPSVKLGTSLEVGEGSIKLKEIKPPPLPSVLDDTKGDPIVELTGRSEFTKLDTEAVVGLKLDVTKLGWTALLVETGAGVGVMGEGNIPPPLPSVKVGGLSNVDTLVVTSEKTLVGVTSKKTLVGITSEKTLVGITSEKTLVGVTSEKTEVVMRELRTVVD